MAVISGSVFKYNGNHSIDPDVVITLSDGSTTQFTRADANGQYSFSVVTPGVYTLTAHYYPTQSTKARQITVAGINLQEDFDFVGLIIPPRYNSYVNLKYFQYGFLAFMGFLLSCCIFYGLYKFDSDDIENIAFARGIITYLIAAGTVVLAIILMFASVMTGGEDLEKRFDLGKQVFTSLVGVLGTVIGFYFGSATNTEKNTIDSLGTTMINFNPVPVKKDSMLTVSFMIKGGVAPYQFKVVDTRGYVDSKDTSSSKPDITLQLKVLKDIKSRSSVNLSVQGIDKNKQPFEGSSQEEN
jgi:hypothetical protein